MVATVKYNSDAENGEDDVDGDDRPWERQELENFARKGYLNAQKKRVRKISVTLRRESSGYF